VIRRISCLLLACLTGSAVAADADEVRLQDHDARASLTDRLTRQPAIRQMPSLNPGEFFVPPSLDEIPEGKYGDLVRMGRDIFVDTQHKAGRYVGNGLNCANCHLAEGRQPYAAPLWGAYPNYPAYRVKTRSVQTYEERIEDCFRYSMNGIAPTLDAPELKALVAYSQWISQGAPANVELPGSGFARLAKPRDPNAINGESIFRDRCALCHGQDGLGQRRADGSYQFPPIWGGDSFNRAAGMNTVKGCAQFVRANMPLGQGWTLTDMESWDVCMYIWIQDRPWDPRRSTLRNLFEEPPGR